MKKNILVTGRPGVGKTTCVRRVAELLTSRGVVVGGMITFEVRSSGRRIGFQILDMQSGRRGWLARKGVYGMPRVGRYTVFLDELESIGVGAITAALEKAQVIVIDEIGPMELYSEKFKETVWKALESSKPVLATIHAKAERYSFGRKVLSRNDVELHKLTLINREGVPPRIAKKIASILSSSR